MLRTAQGHVASADATAVCNHKSSIAIEKLFEVENSNIMTTRVRNGVEVVMLLMPITGGNVTFWDDFSA